MAGNVTKGGRVAAKGAAVGGAAVGGATAEALTTRAGTVALESMVKFLRLLKMHLVEGRKIGGQRQQMGAGTKPEDH